MKNSFVSKGGGNSFISKYMTPAAGGGGVPGGSISWDDIHYDSVYLGNNNGYLIRPNPLTQYPAYRTVLIDVSETLAERIIINTNGDLNRAYHAFSSLTIEEILALPAGYSSNAATIEYANEDFNEDTYYFTKPTGANTLIFFVSAESVDSVTSVELYEAGTLYDGIEYDGYVNTSDGNFRTASGLDCIYVDIAGLDVGEQIKITMTSNGNFYDGAQYIEVYPEFPKVYTSGINWPDIDGSHDVKTPDTVPPIEYVFTKVAGGNTLVFWFSNNGSGVVASVEVV